jgi:REP element-mobilizing transposase RayT
VEFAGAVYHVLDRGDRREEIYADDADRLVFLRTLEEVCRRTGWWVHAYVLMSNHYHLLLETPEPNLVAGMKWFQSTYTMRFNRRHRLGGHFFQGRYKAIVVDPEERNYLVTLSDYIHLNPVRAGLLKEGEKLVSYRWSSYPAYAKGGAISPWWLKRETVLGELGLDDAAGGRRRYAERMWERAREADHSGQEERGWCLGGESFRKRMLVLIDRMNDKLRAGKEVDGAVRQCHGQARAAALLERGLDRLGLSGEDLRRLRKNDERKIAIGRVIRGQTAVSNRWIAERLNLGHVSRVSRYCSAQAVSAQIGSLVERILSD